MHYQIRDCTTNDLQAIFALNRDEMGYEYPISAMKKKMEALLKSSRNKILVAVVQNVVVGYVHACDYDVLYAPHMKNIMGIAVAADCKRQGIGTALLSAIEKWGKETGAAGVRLASGETRHGAHSFYQHCGYSGDKQQIRFIKYF